MERELIIRENIGKIRQRIAQAAAKTGRSAKDIQCVAVTKGVALEDIRSAIRAGIKILAENKVQEARAKFLEIGPAVSWHLIGHLQTNKARPAAAIFDLVQSLDSYRIADALDRECLRLDRQMDVLVEVNIGSEETKTGAEIDQVGQLVRHVQTCANLRLRGVMAMAPYTPDPETVRPFFRQLRQLFEHFKPRDSRSFWNILSMGMTNDFEVAIEEGATLVRIGTGIFHTPELRSEGA